MSTDTPDDRTVKKDVSITAYTKRYTTGQERDYLAALLGQTEWSGDAFATSTSESKDYYVTFGSGDDAERISIRSREYQRLSERRDSDQLDLGDVSFDVEITESEDFVHGTYSLSKKLGTQLALSLDDELPGGVVRESAKDDANTFASDMKWSDADGGQHVQFSMGRPSTERVLRHQQERTDDDRYETDADFLALSLSVNIKAQSQSVMDALSAETVKPMYDRLTGFDGVWKCRLADCKTVTESYGDCYDL